MITRTLEMLGFYMFFSFHPISPWQRFGFSVPGPERRRPSSPGPLRCGVIFGWNGQLLRHTRPKIRPKMPVCLCLFMFVSPCSFHVFKLSRSESEVGLGDPEYDAQDESYEARDGNGRPWNGNWIWTTKDGDIKNIYSLLGCSCAVAEYQKWTW